MSNSQTASSTGGLSTLPDSFAGLTPEAIGTFLPLSLWNEANFVPSTLRTKRDSAIENGPVTLRQQRPALTTTRKDRAMDCSQLPPLDYLRQCLRYDAHTGKLFWLQRPEWMFESSRVARTVNTRHAGKEAFTTVHRTGRLVGTIMGKQILAHRVAYYLGTGEHPSLFVDHINGDPLDNRLFNLRLVNRSENARNRKRTSELWKGDYFGVRQSSKNRWRASIRVDGEVIEIGSFPSVEEAIKARKGAELKYGFHANHGREPTRGAA